jgi:GTPase SAR1 family protein
VTFYTFESLSPLEFEFLSRDLLQVEYGGYFESYPPGPDGGVDARWRRRGDPPFTVVVQYKHRVKSGFSGLEQAMRKEAAKARAIAADRYILATSVDLTDAQKRKLVKIIGRPDCDTQDILSATDLNNRLNANPRIVQAHHKLWLTSAAVLGKLSAATAYLDGTDDVEQMRKKLRRYVPTTAFDRALVVLEEHRVCVIVGGPGVGKTTLAEALMVAHLDKGFQPIRIRRDFREIRGIPDEAQKQIYYHDDFLGSTGLERDRRDDQTLIRWLERVADTPNWRFILTTRDYILQAARERSDSLRHFHWAQASCAVRPEEYTTPVRAEIFYNHLEASALPSWPIAEMAENHRYREVIQHRNFNPRVIEHITHLQRLGRIREGRGEYAAAVFAALAEPGRVWDSAYKHDISDAARHVLLAIFTHQEPVSYQDLSHTFERLQRQGARDRGLKTRPHDLTDASRELDGTMIRIEGPKGRVHIRFENPSIRDYLETYVTNEDQQALDLLEAIHSTSQLRKLWKGRSGVGYPQIRRSADVVARRALAIEEEERRAERERRTQGAVGDFAERVAPVQRVELAMELVETIRSADSRKLLLRSLRSFAEALRAADTDADAAVDVYESMRGRAVPSRRMRVLEELILRMALAQMNDLAGVKRVITIARYHRRALTTRERHEAERRIQTIADNEAKRLSFGGYADDWDEVCRTMEVLQDASERLNLWITHELRALTSLDKRDPGTRDKSPDGQAYSLFDLLESGTGTTPPPPVAVEDFGASFAELARQRASTEAEQ